MDEILPLQQIFRDAVVIYQPARRFPEGRVFQQRVGAVAGIKDQIVLLSGRDAEDLDARFTL